MPWSEREHLLFTVEYAVRQLVGGQIKRAIDKEVGLEVAARKIVEHLELCQYRIIHRPSKVSSANTGLRHYSWPESEPDAQGYYRPGGVRKL